MDIKVAFVRETDPDFVSRQIMAKDKTNYSHVLILFQNDRGQAMIFHAVGQGVCVERPTEFFKDHIISHSFDVTLNKSRDYFLGYVRGSEGKEYSQSQIAALAIGKEADNDDEKMICSELVGIVLTEMAGKSIPGDQDIWKPIDCYNCLR